MHVQFLSMGVWHLETSPYVVAHVVYVAIVHLRFLCEFLLGLPQTSVGYGHSICSLAYSQCRFWGSVLAEFS